MEDDAQEITVIVVSHDIEQAIGCNSRIVFMDEGKIVVDLEQFEVLKDGLLAPYTESRKK